MMAPLPLLHDLRRIALEAARLFPHVCAICEDPVPGGISCDCLGPFALEFCSGTCLGIHLYVPDDSGEICHDGGELNREFRRLMQLELN